MICNKCGISTVRYNSLKGTKLSAGRLGIAFKYCDSCFDELKKLIADYIQPERSKREDALLKEPCGTCLACRWYPCFRNEE